MWNLFEKSDIYEFLTGEKDTVPEFCHNWLTFSAKPTVTINTSKIAETLVPIPQHQLLKRVTKGYSASAPSSPSRALRERKGKVDYKALHLGKAIKEELQTAAKDVQTKCKSMRKSVRKSAKAAMTKLVPGAFSPKQQPPASAPLSPPHSSSSAWNFWASK